MKKINMTVIVIIIIATCFLPITSSKIINNQINSNNVEKVEVLSHIVNEKGKQTNKVFLSEVEINIIKKTLQQTQNAIEIFKSKKSTDEEISKSYKILKDSYSTLKQYGLLSKNINEKKFIELTTGQSNKQKSNRVINLCNRFLPEDEENSSFALATSFLGTGSNVNAMSIIDLFMPVIPVLSFFMSAFASYSKVLSILFLIPLILLVAPLHLLFGIFNVLSSVNGSHSIQVIGNNSYGISENPGIYNKSFFIMTFGLWIEIPTQFSELPPFYSSQWFYLGVGLWLGIK